MKIKHLIEIIDDVLTLKRLVKQSTICACCFLAALCIIKNK